MITVDSGVKVVNGANEGVFPVAGETIATVQASLAEAFNIPIEAFAFVGGRIVAEDYRIESHDTVEFSLLHGLKGAGKRATGSIRPPFPYYGGKYRVGPEVWRRFGEIQHYVEPFLGGGGVLLSQPAGNRTETVNDIDVLLTNFWRSVKFHPRKLASAADYPVSELDLHARHDWLNRKRAEITERIRADTKWCDPQVAAWWVWGISLWIGKGWCDGNPKPSLQRPSLDGLGIHRRGDRLAQLSKLFPLLKERLRNVQILSGDWARVVTPATTTRFGITGVFLDPPYTAESGRQAGLYAQDNLTVGHAVRDWAVEHGDNNRFRIALCGYEGEYRMPRNWSVYEWRAGGSRNGHRERIWFSPHCLP